MAACVAGDFFWVNAKELPGFESAREQVKTLEKYKYFPVLTELNPL